MEFKELTKKDAQISLSMGKDQAFIVFVNIVDKDECPQAFPCNSPIYPSLIEIFQKQLVFVGGCDVR